MACAHNNEVPSRPCARRSSRGAPSHGYARASAWKSSRCANLVEERRYHRAKAPQTPDATNTRNTAAVTVDNKKKANSDVTATPARRKSHLKAASAPKRCESRLLRASERRHRVMIFVLSFLKAPELPRASMAWFVSGVSYPRTYLWNTCANAEAASRQRIETLTLYALTLCSERNASSKARRWRSLDKV